MTRNLIAALGALLLGLGGGALLGGCGSSKTTTTTASAAASVPASTRSVPTQPSTRTATAPASTGTAPATAAGGGTPAPSTTRTAAAPAFTQQEAHAEGVSAAAELVRARGYTPNDTSQYHSGQSLRVLVGTRTGSSDGYGQQAFFFLGGRYIGTDTKEPSATVKLLAQGDSEVTLAYPLYRKGDPLGSPSGGQATVRFQLADGKLVPLGQIPPASSASGLARD